MTEYHFLIDTEIGLDIVNYLYMYLLLREGKKKILDGQVKKYSGASFSPLSGMLNFEKKLHLITAKNYKKILR